MSSEVEGSEVWGFTATASDLKKAPFAPAPHPTQIFAIASFEACNPRLASRVTGQPRPQHHDQLRLISGFRKDVCGTLSPTSLVVFFLHSPTELKAETNRAGVVLKPIVLFGFGRYGCSVQGIAPIGQLNFISYTRENNLDSAYGAKRCEALTWTLQLSLPSGARVSL